MNLHKMSIQQVVIDILTKKTYVPKDILSEENWDVPLTGRLIRLNAIDLVYAFFEIEKVFGIRVSDEHLNTYGFNSVNNITSIVENAIGR